MNIRAIIVEDELHNRENLLQLISESCPDIQVVAVCSSAEEGQESINRLQPDLVFLDIEMPGGSGFSLLESLPVIDFEIIFVTAYDNYGIQAIKFSALDYILKPIDPIEFANAIDKVRNIQAQKQENLRLQNMLENASRANPHKRIALHLSDKIEFVEIASIIRCESDSNYTIFYLKNDTKLLVSRTLKEYEDLLASYNFLRIHQSHLINLKEIKSYIKSDGGYIQMKDGSSVSISRQRREMVLNALKDLA